MPSRGTDEARKYYPRPPASRSLSEEAHKRLSGAPFSTVTDLVVLCESEDCFSRNNSFLRRLRVVPVQSIDVLILALLISRQVVLVEQRVDQSLFFNLFFNEPLAKVECCPILLFVGQIDDFVNGFGIVDFVLQSFSQAIAQICWIDGRSFDSLNQSLPPAIVDELEECQRIRNTD